MQDEQIIAPYPVVQLAHPGSHCRLQLFPPELAYPVLHVTVVQPPKAEQEQYPFEID